MDAGLDRKHNGCAEAIYLNATASVLSLRGKSVTRQPITGNVDHEAPVSSFLCWNGEAWKIGESSVAGSDSPLVFELLQDATTACDCSEYKSLRPEGSSCVPPQDVLAAIKEIAGPFAFAFYDSLHQKLYYGRDCLGRRSLLHEMTPSGSLVISSIANVKFIDTQADDPPDSIGQSEGHAPSKESSAKEVPAGDIYVFDLKAFAAHQRSLGSLVERSGSSHDWQTHPYFARITRHPEDPSSQCSLAPLNRHVPGASPPSVSRLWVHSSAVSRLEQQLFCALKARVLNIPLPPQLKQMEIEHMGKVAILFSGGLDCTVLARISHEILPIDEPIHLINVAFENPRIVAARMASKRREGEIDSLEASPYEACPDRITGRESLSELQQVCPERRWIFLTVSTIHLSRLFKSHLLSHLVQDQRALC